MPARPATKSGVSFDSGENRGVCSYLVHRFVGTNVEGHELAALRGVAATIGKVPRRHSPAGVRRM